MLIALAATVEASSAHPLAKAVVAEAKRRKVPTSKPPASRPWQVGGGAKPFFTPWPRARCLARSPSAELLSSRFP